MKSLKTDEPTRTRRTRAAVCSRLFAAAVAGTVAVGSLSMFASVMLPNGGVTWTN